MKTRRLFIGMGALVLIAALTLGTGMALAQLTWTKPIPNPDIDYTKPNYAYSPILKKFQDPLYIPTILAGPDATLPDGSELYYIGLKDFTWQFHSFKTGALPSEAPARDKG